MTSARPHRIAPTKITETVKLRNDTNHFGMTMYPLPFIPRACMGNGVSVSLAAMAGPSSDGVFPQGWQLGLFLLERRSHVGAGH